MIILEFYLKLETFQLEESSYTRQITSARPEEVTCFHCSLFQQDWRDLIKVYRFVTLIQ